MIWTGRIDADPAAASVEHVTPRRPAVPFVARAQSMLAVAAARDPLAMDLRAATVAASGSRILQILTRAATASASPSASVDAALAREWNVGSRGVDVVRAALILCADHELNVSAFTARCVASAGAHPYAVVIAALAALEGPKHGGASARVESMLESMRRARPLRSAMPHGCAAASRSTASVTRSTATAIRAHGCCSISWARTCRCPLNTVRQGLRASGERRPPANSRTSILRSRHSPCPQAAVRLPAGALRHRPEHRLDWTCDGAVRERTTDSATRQVRSAFRHDRRNSPVHLLTWEDSVTDQRYELQPIGRVESPLIDRASAPKQGDEGSPEAWLVLDARFAEAFRDLEVGEDVIVLTWLDRARRDVLVVHPRGNPANPLQGVFSTRSPDRPNPIGLHRVKFSRYRAGGSRSATWRRSTGRRSSISSRCSTGTSNGEALRFRLDPGTVPGRTGTDGRSACDSVP